MSKTVHQPLLVDSNVELILIFILFWLQIRKTHFPPRPRHRKKRSALSDRTAQSTQKTSDSNSSLSSAEEKVDEPLTRNNGNDCAVDKYLGNASASKLAMRWSANKLNAYSAGDSSCCSSQELSPDEQQPPLIPTVYVNTCLSSQETYCSEIELADDKATKRIRETLFESNYPNSQESIYPNSEEFSQASSRNLLEDVCQTAQSITKTDSLSSTESMGSSSRLFVPRNDKILMRPTTLDLNLNGVTTSGKSDTLKVAQKRKADDSTVWTDSDVNLEDLKELAVKRSKTTLLDGEAPNGRCIVCLTEAKNAAFVHNRFAHVCCCYRCTVKIWNKRKKCPICNQGVKTILKLFVH